MKDVHHTAIKEITGQFGPCEPVADEDSGLQVGWEINATEESIRFNFTEDAIRIFKIIKKVPSSKYKSLELLRQCAKKSGLQELVYYQFDASNEIGNVFVSKAGKSGDGLDEIEHYYKVSDKSAQDSLGGALIRIGSRRR